MLELVLLASLTATPLTLDSVIGRAKPGDTIRLAQGDYGQVSIKNRQWPRPIVIEAAAAHLLLSIHRSSGIVVKGGIFGPANDRLGYASRIVMSSRISFEGARFQNSKRGMVIDRSRQISVRRAIITGMTIDGINIASSQQISVVDSSCSDFKPLPKTHPDCIQLWSRPKEGITSDVQLIGNRSSGDMQGLTAFNHVRNGVNDGGFDRIEVRNNVVDGTFPQGIALYDCRNCSVVGNRTRRLPGARWKVSVNVVRCIGCEVKLNDVGR